MLLHCVSMSGGKDSTATAILALETMPSDILRFIFADTGNEHELTYEYIDYLEGALDVEITRLRRDFTEEWWHRRRWIEKHGEAKHNRKAAQRLLAFFDRGPSGNPFLDLCCIKGAFPTARKRWCTQFLKTEPITEHYMELLDSGQAEAIWSWQGIRLDESTSRRNALQGTGACTKSFEVVGGGIYINRPILRWKAADCFEAHRLHQVKPNPLYLQAMTRVGCMPCIMVGKGELRDTALRFPEHIDRIAEWESLVAMASWSGWAAFFIGTDRRISRTARGGIHEHVEWAKTSRGGSQYNMDLLLDEPEMCSSAYGLCE